MLQRKAAHAISNPRMVPVLLENIRGLEAEAQLGNGKTKFGADNPVDVAADVTDHRAE